MSYDPGLASKDVTMKEFSQAISGTQDVQRPSSIHSPKERILVRIRRSKPRRLCKTPSGAEILVRIAIALLVIAVGVYTLSRY